MARALEALHANAKMGEGATAVIDREGRDEVMCVGEQRVVVGDDLELHGRHGVRTTAADAPSFPARPPSRAAWRSFSDSTARRRVRTRCTAPSINSAPAGLKAIAIDERLAVTAEFQVHFDSDLPEFKTQGGVHRAVDGNALTVTSPPLMWLAAIDKLLHNMKAAKFPFERVVAVSGSGQQHGSVFWKSGADADLKSMHGDKVLLRCVFPALTL